MLLNMMLDMLLVKITWVEVSEYIWISTHICFSENYIIVSKLYFSE